MLKGAVGSRTRGQLGFVEVHHGIGRHQAAGAVRADDVVEDGLAVGAELNPVHHARRYFVVRRVADTVALDDLKAGFASGATGLDDEALAVTVHQSAADVLEFKEREAASDIASAGSPLLEVHFCGVIPHLVARLGLGLDACPDRVEGHVRQHLTDQAGVQFQPAHLARGLHAVEDRHGLLEVLRPRRPNPRTLVAELRRLEIGEDARTRAAARRLLHGYRRCGSLGRLGCFDLRDGGLLGLFWSHQSPRKLLSILMTRTRSMEP